jgi:hypothetical protein
MQIPCGVTAAQALHIINMVTFIYEYKGIAVPFFPLFGFQEVRPRPFDLQV